MRAWSPCLSWLAISTSVQFNPLLFLCFLKALKQSCSKRTSTSSTSDSVCDEPTFQWCAFFGKCISNPKWQMCEPWRFNLCLSYVFGDRNSLGDYWCNDITTQTAPQPEFPTEPRRFPSLWKEHKSSLRLFFIALIKPFSPSRSVPIIKKETFCNHVDGRQVRSHSK